MCRIVILPYLRYLFLLFSHFFLHSQVLPVYGYGPGNFFFYIRGDNQYTDVNIIIITSLWLFFKNTACMDTANKKKRNTTTFVCKYVLVLYISVIYKNPLQNMYMYESTVYIQLHNRVTPELRKFFEFSQLILGYK